jgi:DivIVA domain-containing protein
MATDLPRLSPADTTLSADLIAQRGFALVRRGFDADEVRAFLAQVAKEFRAMRQREAAVEEALREAEYRASHPRVDEETLLSAVGEETASILRSAHAAAADIRAKAEDNAARILKEAQERADAMRGQAETVLGRRTDEAEAAAAKIRETAASDTERIRTAARQRTEEAAAEAAKIREAAAADGERIRSSVRQQAEEAEASAAKIREAAAADAERIRNSARQQAETVRQQTEAELRATRKATVEAAQTTRERILTDLARRRKLAAVQIDQLRAGRERLLEAYRVVRRTLDEVTAELERADVEARAAAEAVGRRQAAPEDTKPAEAVEAGVNGTEAAAEPTESVEPVTGDGKGEPAATVTEIDLDADDEDEDVEEEVQPEEAERPQKNEPIELGMDHGRAVNHPQRGNGTGSRSVGTAAVESLFARIRADREGSVAKGREVLSDTSVKEDEEEFVEESEIPTSDVDEALLQQRDEAVGTIEATLARRLKRVLQDEQNDLLDRLRNTRGEPTAAEILPDRDARVRRIARTSRPLLDQAAKAGLSFAASILGEQAPTGGRRPPELDDLAMDLATSVVDPLRRRLEQVFADDFDDDPSVLAESLGAAYREWKTQRIELAASDHIAGAFNRGTLAATPDGMLLRWIVEDIGGPCPDCDDNALAGELPKGEPFPTGQLYPPAHAGCRCLLVPSPGGGN